LQQRHKKDVSHYSLIASALIAMGILDGFHASVAAGNNFVWLHSLAVLAGGLLFSAAWLRGQKISSKGVIVLPATVAVITIIIGLFSITFPWSLPEMLSQGAFTSAALAVNVLGGFFFVLGAVHFLARYHRQGDMEDVLFAFFCFLNASAGFLFWFSQPWNIQWWLWHLLRVLAYFILLGYLFLIYRRTEAELSDTKEKLEMKAELEKTNLALESEIAERKQIENNLRKAMQEVQEGVNILASAVSQILTSTKELAAVSAETATAVSQTTVTVEEVKQTVRLANEKSRNVSDSAQQAAQVAQQGQAAVAETIKGINLIKKYMASVAESIVKLSEQNQAIGEIISTVNDLAQQSNLLAVNAAIEAAKAGEQGKGFAVVAQEVKSLADQSKQATFQVRSILNDIQQATGAAVMTTEQVAKAVEASVGQATESGDSIARLTENVTEAANALLQVVASSQQQSVGMDQIALAMENIKQAAQQNTLGTRQAEESAQSLNELGQKLKAMVNQYLA
jgi:methyl-accepting chemotaxis protein